MEASAVSDYVNTILRGHGTKQLSRLWERTAEWSGRYQGRVRYGLQWSELTYESRQRSNH